MQLHMLFMRTYIFYSNTCAPVQAVWGRRSGLNWTQALWCVEYLQIIDPHTAPVKELKNSVESKVKAYGRWVIVIMVV